MKIILVGLENEGGVLPCRFFGRTDGLEDFVLDFDEFLCGFERFCVFGADQRDRIAEIVGYLADGDEGGLIFLYMADVDLAGDVVCCQNADHAGQSLGLFCIYRDHPSAGIGAADGAAEAHAVNVQVVGVFAGPLNLFGYVDTAHAGAYVIVGVVGWYTFFSDDLSGEQYAVDDLDIAGTATDVVPDGVGGFCPRGVGVSIYEGFCRHYHSGDAKAALYRAGLAEGVGVGRLLKVGETLDGEDGFALQLRGAGDAGLGELAVDEDVTCAARAFAAAVLYACKAQLVAQESYQLLILFNGDGPAVDRKSRHTEYPLCTNTRLIYIIILAQNK